MGTKRLQRGSILVLTVWTLVMLALFSFSVSFLVRQKLNAIGRLETRDKLRYIAESGIQKAIYVLNKKEEENSNISTLKESWASSESDFNKIPIQDGFFIVAGGSSPSILFEEDSVRKNKIRFGVIDEERKINLNKESSADVLAELLQFAAGIDKETARTIAFSILDWKDDDSYTYLLGAENKYYKTLDPPYRAKNSGFSTLEELMLVKGMTPDIYELVEPYFTIDGDGLININTTSVEVLKAFGLSHPLIKKITAFRAGADGVEGTDDDRVFKSIGEVVSALEGSLSLTEEEKELLLEKIQAKSFKVDSEYYSMKSIAKLMHRPEWIEINAIYKRYEKIKRWRERFGVISK